MIGAVIVTHGNLATELLEAAARIFGPTEAIHAVALDWDVDVSSAGSEIGAAVRAADRGAGVLVFTDMFGGTPTNISLSFLEENKVEIITGVNLPMIVKLASLQDSDEPLLEVARKVRDRGQRSIYVASENLSSREPV